MALSRAEQRIQQAMNTLQSQGYTREQAAGIVGNWLAESGPNLNPQQVENQDRYGNVYRDEGTTQDVINGIPGPGTGYGLAQYTPSSRQRAFKKALEDMPTDWNGYQASVEAAAKEIADSYPGFAKAKTLEDAARYGLKTYENPKDKSESVAEARIAKARLAYNLGTDTAPDALTTDPTLGNTHLYRYGPDQSLAEDGAQRARIGMPSNVNLGGGLGDVGGQSAGMSFTPALPAPMPQPAPSVMDNYGFSNFGSMGYNPQFAQPVTPQNPPAASRYDPLSSISPPSQAPQPGWGSIAGNAIGAARPSPSTPDFGPMGNTPGLGMPAVSTPDYTTGSNGSFQTAPPSTMAPGPTGATLAGGAIGAMAPVSAIPTFSSIRPQMSAVTTALAAADAETQKNAELAAAYKPPRLRDDMYGVAPTVEPPTAAVTAPKAPQVQKVQPRIAPKPVPMQPPHPPSVPMTQKDLNSYGLGDSPGSQLAASIGTPQQFMGTSTSPQDFAKTVAAVAAINGSKDAQTYASQLSDPHLGGVAFDALNNEYAKATNQMQTPTLYDRAALSPIGRMLGMTANQLPFNGYGAANSPMPMNGMYVQGANGQPTYATYSQDQQRALQNSSGLLGSLGNMLGIGAGANNGWGGAGSMGYGAGTSGLY